MTIDPGEMVGWATWEGTELVDAGQTPDWEFVDALDRALTGGVLSVEEAQAAQPFVGVRRIVMEDWTLDPSKCKDLAWDPILTLRTMGAIQLLSRQHGLDYVLQSRTIKSTAKAGGAEELFFHPLYENRHQNDAIMHGVFYIQTELLNPTNAVVKNGRLVPREA